MTNNTIFNFDRLQSLKTWQPIQNQHLTPEETQYYYNKMQEDNVDIRYPQGFISNAYFNPQDARYLRLIALIYMINLIEYIKNQGVILEDVEWNIKQILNEIITNQVSEDYYLNTIDIYESISGSIYDEKDIYELIDQAIKLDNRRMLYYLIFKEDEEIADRLSEVIRE